MLSESSEDELITTASMLTGAQLVHLAHATRKSMGSRLAAYLGLQVRRSSAFQPASKAVHRAGRDRLMDVKVSALADALLEAAIEAATKAGRDTSPVQPAWERYKVSIDSEGRRRQKRASQSARRTLRQGLGRQLHERWLLANIGAGWALMALVSWDLATKTGPYTPEHREALTKPWMTVAPLPFPED